jgi:hypothetical protein
MIILVYQISRQIFFSVLFFSFHRPDVEINYLLRASLRGKKNLPGVSNHFMPPVALLTCPPGSGQGTVDGKMFAFD